MTAVEWMSAIDALYATPTPTMLRRSNPDLTLAYGAHLERVTAGKNVLPSEMPA